MENFFRHDDVREMHAGAGFIHHVDRFIGKVSVSNVAIAQPDGRDDCLVGIVYAVMLFIFMFDVLQNLDRFINRRRVNHDLLEPPVECTVLLNVLAVFVQRRRTDALQFSA